MKVETEWFDYETDDRDAEIARNLKATAESVRDLATYVAGETRQPCHNCGNTRACRPLALQDDAGHLTQAPICAPCQAEFVEAKVEQARQQGKARKNSADPDDHAPGSRERTKAREAGGDDE